KGFFSLSLKREDFPAAGRITANLGIGHPLVANGAKTLALSYSDRPPLRQGLANFADFPEPQKQRFLRVGQDGVNLASLLLRPGNQIGDARDIGVRAHGSRCWRRTCEIHRALPFRSRGNGPRQSLLNGIENRGPGFRQNGLARCWLCHATSLPKTGAYRRG